MENEKLEYGKEREQELANGQHMNADGQTDAQKGAMLGGVGGAVTGAIAGAMVGPVGAVVGGVVGAVAGGLGSGAAVAQVDKIDNDNTTTGVGPDDNDVDVDHPGMTPPPFVPTGPDPNRPRDPAFPDSIPDTNNPMNRPLNEDQDPSRQHPYEPKAPYTPTDPNPNPVVTDPPDPMKQGGTVPIDPRTGRPENRPF